MQPRNPDAAGQRMRERRVAEHPPHGFSFVDYYWKGRKAKIVSGLTAFLYQRDGEIIAFARPDLAVTGTGLSSAALEVDIRAMSVA